MWGEILVVGAVLAVAVCSGRLTDREYERQRQMRRDYDSYCSQRRSEYINTVSEYRSCYNATRAEYERKFEEERRRRIEELKERNRPYIDEICNNIKEQKQLKRTDLDKLLSILKQWNNMKSEAQNTMLRMKSVKKIILSIEEATYKLQAYFVYLDRYEHNMLYQFEKNGSIPEPFEMALPGYFPYAGKIYEIKKDDFEKRNDTYVYSVPDEKNLSLFLSKYEVELFEESSYDTINVMACYNNKTENLTSMLSISRAHVKLSISSRQGIYASIDDIKGQNIQLSYYGCKMTLPRSNLKNPSHSFPKGSYLTVYLTDYNFALIGYPKVSQKIQDSLSLASFENIGMLLTSEQMKMLFQELQKNNWLDFEDEWRIGPFDKNESPVRRVKVQMGDYYGYLAEFQEIPGKPDQMQLVFQRMLQKNELFSFTDVFAAADVTVEGHSLVSTYNNESLAKECALLYSYLIGEFSLQVSILNQSPMMLYFDKWTELTKRLIDVIQYKNRHTFLLDSWQQSRNRLYLYSNDSELIASWKKEVQNKYVENQESKYAGIYFLRNPEKEGNEYLFCKAEFQEETQELQILVKNIPFDIRDTIEREKFQFELIFFRRASAEKAQLSAFSDFREGNICCAEIKKIILHTSELQYIDTDRRIVELYNKTIQDNLQQSEAVHRAFAVKDFYLIQGPPGTGKTTVIKELIMQQLHSDSLSKILVVSQANVAVDNVIRGIQKICDIESCISPNQIIRCGSDDKIADDIQQFSYEGRLNSYMSALKSSPSDNPDLRNKWISFAEEQDNRGIISDCLLRGFQIIGATCVGFANKNIGLSGMVFDLVIIDEAGKALLGELLIPINHAKKLIIIGDHKQLPPVVNPEYYNSGEVKTDDVLEENERIDFFQKSFFERLWDDCPKTNKSMLQTQFRMPPVIAGLVNLFYDGQLQSGTHCFSKKPIAFDSHLVMLDMKDVPEYKEDKEKQSGPYNLKEQEVVVELISAMRTVYSDTKRIVVITPYKQQKKQLIQKLRCEIIKNVSVNTIDAFQGDEEEIVIYCMTRSRTMTEYFSDSARLNVAFSRAKNLLIIIGSTAYLKKYGKDHVLYQVHRYISDFGRIVLYSSFRADTSIVRNTNKYQDVVTVPLSIPEKTEFNQEQFFPSELSIQKIVSQKCVACGADLHENESMLCFNCLNAAKTITCKACGKEFQYSNYLFYVKKLKSTGYCDSCSTIVKCDCCGKTFKMSNSKVKYNSENNKGNYCSKCSNYPDKKCCCCGKTYKAPFNENSRKYAYCSSCQSMTKVKCDCCGRSFEMPYYMVYYNSKNNKRNYCDSCRSMTSIICDCCGGSIEMPYFKFREISKKNTRYYCDSCRAMKKIKCDCCGQSFETPYFMVSYNSKNNKRNYCYSCRTMKEIRCDCCGQSFEMPCYIILRNKKENHKIYCDNCRQAVTAICYRCGTPFDMPYWMKKQIDERGKNTYCPDCRSSFRH